MAENTEQDKNIDSTPGDGVQRVVMNPFRIGVTKPGDVIELTFNDNGRTMTERQIVDCVVEPGKDTEEIILDEKTNSYFISKMAEKGTSWAKDVKHLGID